MNSAELSNNEKNKIIKYIKTLKYAGYTDEQINETLTEQYVKHLINEGHSREKIKNILVNEDCSQEEVNVVLSEANWNQIGQDLLNTGKNFVNRTSSGVQDAYSGLKRDLSTPEGAASTPVLAPAKSAYRFARGFMRGNQQPAGATGANNQTGVKGGGSAQVPQPVQQQPVQQQPVQQQPVQQQPVQQQPKMLKPAKLTRTTPQGKGSWDLQQDPQTGRYYDNSGNDVTDEASAWLAAGQNQPPATQGTQSKMPVKNAMKADADDTSSKNDNDEDAHSSLHKELKEHGVVGKTFDYQVKNFRKLMGMQADGGWTKEVADAWKKFKEFRSNG